MTIGSKVKSCRYMMFSLNNFYCIATRLALCHSYLSKVPIDEIFVKRVSQGAIQQKLLRENIMYRHDLAFDVTTANIFLKSWRQKDYNFQTYVRNLKFCVPLYGAHSNFYSNCMFIAPKYYLCLNSILIKLCC